MKKKILFLLAMFLILPGSLLLTACGGGDNGGGKVDPKTCGHTNVIYFKPDADKYNGEPNYLRDEIYDKLCNDYNITEVGDEYLFNHLQKVQFERDITYRAENEQGSTEYFRYNKYHYVSCTICGTTKAEEHTFVKDEANSSDVKHDITCSDCGYHHEAPCNFDGDDMNEPVESPCFCGNTKPTIELTQVFNDNTCSLTISTKHQGELVIPATYKGMGVRYVFLSNDEAYEGVTSLEIENGVNVRNIEDLDDGPKFPNLVSLKIDGLLKGYYGEPVTSLSFDKPYTKLKTIDAPYISGLSINCPNAESIVAGSCQEVYAPNAILTANYAFDLTAKVFNYKGDQTYDGKRNWVIETFNAPELTEVGYKVFLNSPVKTVNAPKLKTIKAWAFANCQNLEKFDLNNLEYLDTSAFASCPNFKDIVISNNKDVTLARFPSNYPNPGQISIDYNTFSVTANKIYLKANDERNSYNYVNANINAKNIILKADTLKFDGAVCNSSAESVTLDTRLITTDAYCSGIIADGLNNTFNLKTINYNVEEIENNANLFYDLNQSELTLNRVNITYNIGTRVKELPHIAKGDLRQPIEAGDFIPIKAVVFDENSKITTIKAYNLSYIMATSITLPASVTAVENYAFAYSKLQTLNMDNCSSIDISSASVYNCEDYQFELVDNVYYFGETAVKLDKNASGDVTLRAGTKYISNINYKGFLADVTNNVNLILPDSFVAFNVIKSDNSSEDYQFKLFGDKLVGINIPNGVTEIPDKVFKNTSIISLTLPNTVTTIGDFAFYRSKIETINLGNVKTIGESTFAESYITSADISSLTSMGEEAFYNSQLTSIVIPGTIKEIPNRAFQRCYELSNVVISEGVEKICNEAFNMSDIVTLSLPTSLRTVCYGAFWSCGKVENFSLPEGLVEIGDRAFEMVNNEVATPIERFVIPSSVLTIGTRAFNGLNAKTVVIPSSVKVLNSEVFSYAKIESVEFGEGLEEIKEKAFNKCENLVSITLPASVTSVSSKTFSYCSKLETINTLSDLVLPEDVTDSTLYKGQVFDGLYYKGTKLVGIKDTFKTFIYIKDGTTTMADDVFINKKLIKAVYIPSILTLTNNAFSGCSADLKYLFQGAFQGGKGITYDTSKVIVNADADKNGFVYSVGQNAVTLLGYYGNDMKVIIPQTYKDKPVTIIGEYAFKNSSITSVTIGDNVVDIYGGAFMNCADLVEVNISSNLRMLNNLVFNGCNKLQRVTILGDSFYIYTTNYDPSTGETATAVVSVTDANLIKYLTETYSDYLWIRNLDISE